jgi:hypothetical protein
VPLLHRFEQGSLGLGRRTVDLVGQDDMSEDRSGDEGEPAPARVGIVLEDVGPVMSEGIMSGVNWMRRNERLRIRATVLTSSVLASPGTPTSRTCPRARRPVSRSSTTGS